MEEMAARFGRQWQMESRPSNTMERAMQLRLFGTPSKIGQAGLTLAARKLKDAADRTKSRKMSSTETQWQTGHPLGR